MSYYKELTSFGVGTIRRECEEDSIKDWRREEEKGKESVGEFIRASDRMLERE